MKLVCAHLDRDDNGNFEISVFDLHYVGILNERFNSIKCNICVTIERNICVTMFKELRNTTHLMLSYYNTII